MQDSIRLAILKRAWELAGGGSKLSHWVGVTSDDLDAMLAEKMEIPQWLFLRLVDYIVEGIHYTPALDADGDAPGARS